VPVPYESSEWLDALGVALREARQEHGMSQLALGLEVAKPGRKPAHRNYISDLERGQRNPTVKYIVEVVNELDGDLVKLFARAEELLATANTGPKGRRPDSNRGPLHYESVEETWS
jgi:transcriptional regulator with XRE-family HTH domain